MSDESPGMPHSYPSVPTETTATNPKAQSELSATPCYAAYGILDPDYARIYSVIRCLAWSEGYALMMHGSFTRDLDLVAVPWTDKACDPEHLVRRVLASNLKLTEAAPGKPGSKPHSRRVWTLMLPEFGDPRWIDLSIFTPHNS